MPKPPGTHGFTEACFKFLRDLAANNEKPWFEANRATYEATIKLPLASLVDAVAAELRQRDLPLEGAPKRSTFRIHRDVRFGKDKSPYKTSIGTVWHRQGSGKDGAGVLYFHLSPTGCFIASAFYMPEPEALDAIRERIRVHPDQWQAMQSMLSKSGVIMEEGYPLTRMPKGYEDLKDAPVSSAIRMRSFIARQSMTAQLATSAKLVPTIADFAVASLPLLRFGWAAIDEVSRSA